MSEQQRIPTPTHHMSKHRTPENVVPVMGYRVFNDSLETIAVEGPPRLISTISPISYGMATKDDEFCAALKQSDFLVLDGVYFGIAPVLLKGRRIRINNGPSVFHHFLWRMNREQGRIFLLGSMPATLQKMEARMAAECPGVRVASYSPPFKAAFSDEDNAAMISAINEFKPDVLFVGMTAPKQEKWANQHRERVHAGLIVSIGAVFDWYAGTQPEIAPIWWKLHLGWLIRAIHRPEVLKRYPNIGVYFWHLFLATLRIKRFE